MPIVKLERDNAHWYSSLGEAKHDADLRQARKDLLLPSVTSVLSVWPNFMLDNYKIEQAILAAVTLPRIPNEPEDAFVSRVVVDSNTHRKEAAAFGRAIHSCCETINTTGEMPAQCAPEILGQVTAYFQWYKDNVQQVLSAETIAVNHRLGFAGQYDLAATMKCFSGAAIVDLKTQDFKDRGKATFYETWDMQLAAYATTINEYIPGMIQHRVSVVLNSNRDAKGDFLRFKHWKDEDHDESFRKFMACLNLWRESRNYFFAPAAKAAIEKSVEAPGVKAAAAKLTKRPLEQTDDEWLASLCSSIAYQGVDVAKEYEKMKIWCGTTNKIPSRRRFVNWINRVEKPILKTAKVSDLARDNSKLDKLVSKL